MENCLFCKIIRGDIPSAKVYEDDDMIIIKDIAPQAPVHLLLIPKEHYANIIEMSDAQAQTLAKCLKKWYARRVSWRKCLKLSTVWFGALRRWC